MAMRVRSGMFAMCMAMAPPDRREFPSTKSESGQAHSLALRPEEGDDDGGADQAETPRGRVVVDCIGRITAMFTLAEEYVDDCSNWAGGQALRP